MAGSARGFASDNQSGVHPEVLAAIQVANQGHVHSYGDDPYTDEAVAAFREHFGERVEVFFVLTGTGANVTALASLTRSHNAIICAETSHLNTDECAAPEKFTGCKLLTTPSSDGKLTVALIGTRLRGRLDEHQAQPNVVSITQVTELGTVYTPAEIREIADFAHEQGLLLHMDGARLSNAAAALGLELAEVSGDAGVDVLSFGGTKNGLLLGEAVVFFNAELASTYRFARKQGTQLVSKMRFVSAQFTALLSNDRWRRNARHANEMARLLERLVQGVNAVDITQKVEANAIFARLPKEAIPTLQERYFFYVTDEELGEVRLMTSFDTTEEDVRGFAALIKEVLG